MKFSTLKDYGVDKVFWLENGNVDASQKNIIFLAKAEKATKVQAIAGTLKYYTFGDFEDKLRCLWSNFTALILVLRP